MTTMTSTTCRIGSFWRCHAVSDPTYGRMCRRLTVCVCALMQHSEGGDLINITPATFTSQDITRYPSEAMSTCEFWDPSTPDLWVPYVLLGFGCVTFLAVHFWCYHKRNRNRYLLQREEKQLKSGLMERRRIATLILAKYQTQLGINESSTGVELPETCIDNSMEGSSCDPQCSGYSHQVCVDVIRKDVSTCLTADMAAASAAEASSSYSSERWPKTCLGEAVPDITSWPRLDENQAFLGSATKRRPKNISAVYSCGLGESSISVITSPEEFVMNTCEPSPHRVNNRNRLPLLYVPYTAATARRKIRRPGEISSKEVAVPGQRQHASSGRGSDVFYTDTSSDTQYPDTSSFPSQPLERLHSDNSPAESHRSRDDQCRARLTLNQWRDYQQKESQEVLLTSFINYGDGTTSDNYGSETAT